MMTSSYFSHPISFIIDTLFYLFQLTILLRLMVQWLNLPYQNPAVQVVINLSQAPVRFFRQFIPAIGRWDIATIMLLVVITLVKLGLLSWLKQADILSIYLLRLMLADILTLFIGLYTFTIIIEVILSWLVISEQTYPIADLVQRINAPLLNPIRQHIPMIAHIDFSPLIALIGLQVISMLSLPIILG